jgi:serine/threonine protein kinase/tetratricopeptide (TPR) repeat protein
MASETPSFDTIFCAAIDIPSAEGRADYIARASGDDNELRGRVEKLVAAHFQAGRFMESPASPLPSHIASLGPQVMGVATMDEPIREALGKVIGPYKLLQQIGEGGMGTVFMAEQTHPVQRKVAIKVIKPGMDSRQVIARFEAERQALAMMDHVNIARVLDAGTTSEVRGQKSEVRDQKSEVRDQKSEARTDELTRASLTSDLCSLTPCSLTPASGRPYFVMELVHGEPITKYCDDNHLTPRERLELFVPVCQAIQHAHQKGIIHRDIKPSNVMITLYDGKPFPKVIDFGVAKATEQKLTERTLFTQYGTMVGTLEYMSPEQAEMSSDNVGIDTRSDIYSLGVLLYELLTGNTPLSHKTMKEAAYVEILRMIKEEEPPKPSTRLSDSGEALASISANRHMQPAKLTKLVRGELDWIVMKCLEKNRNRRYETANGIAMDVQRYLADEPVLACPPSTVYRLKKFVRRNKGPMLAASLVLLTLVAGIVGTTWQALRAEQARLAEANRAEGERLAKDRAEANFALANDSVEKYLGTVTNDPELKQADFHQLRKRLLESAIPFFQRIAAQKSDDPAVEARRGRAYLRLALVRMALGENEAAIQDFESMRAIFARLTADFPTVPDYAQQLARSHHNLGMLLKALGKLGEAEAAYRAALKIFEELTDETPSVPAYRQDLAACHNNLGNLLYGLGKRGEAEAAYHAALKIKEQLAADFATVPAYRQNLATSQNNLGNLLAGLGKSGEAAAAYYAALKIQEQLALDFPSVPEYRQELARSNNNLGLLLTNMGKRAEADAVHRAALKVQEQLAREFASVPEYEVDLGASYCNFGHLVREKGETQAALDWFANAIGTLEPVLQREPRLVTARTFLRNAHWGRALALDMLQRHGAAVQDWDRAIELDDGEHKAEFQQSRTRSLILGGLNQDPVWPLLGSWPRW